METQEQYVVRTHGLAPGLAAINAIFAGFGFAACYAETPPEAAPVVLWILLALNIAWNHHRERKRAKELDRPA